MVRGQSFRMYAERLCTDGEDIWFAQYDVNILYRIDIKLKCVKKIYVIPFMENLGALYGAIRYHNGKIWLVPMTACRFVIFDIASESFDTIELETVPNWRLYWRYRDAYIFDNALYCFPFAAPYLTRIDTTTMELKHIANYSEEYGKGKDLIVDISICVKDGVYISSAVGLAGFIMYDAKKNVSHRILTDRIDGSESYDLACEGNFVYVHGQETKIIKKIDLKTGEVIKTISARKKGQAVLFVLFNQYLVVDYCLFPEYEIYDRELNLVSTKQTTELHNAWDRTCYHGIWDNIGQLAVYFDNCSNSLNIFQNDIVTPSEMFELHPDRSWIIDLGKYIKETSENVIYENSIWSLEEFMASI